MDGCWTSAQKPKEKVKHQLDRYSKTHWEIFMNFFPRERPIMTFNIRVGKGVQDSPEKLDLIG